MQPSSMHYAVFHLLKPDALGARAFESTRRTRTVAGMLRHAVAQVARRQDLTNLGKPRYGSAFGAAEAQQRYLDRLNARIDGLLRKAFRQAGFAADFVQQMELDWSATGFMAGLEPASRYLPPDNLNRSTRLHVLATFPSSIRGPLAIGSGRFRGFGLLVAKKS